MGSYAVLQDHLFAQQQVTNLVLGAWGSVSSGTAADLNQDLVVDAVDLAYVLGNWGDCPSDQID